MGATPPHRYASRLVSIHALDRMMKRCFALVPAAGCGSRFGAGHPKQYAQLLGQPLIAHTLRTLAEHPRVARVFVVLDPADAYWRDAAPGRDVAWMASCSVLRVGGASRAESVGNGLAAMRASTEAPVDEDDWVLVHDAARPCLSARALTRLIETLQDDPVGGILAIPVADTLKRAMTAGGDAVRIADTVDRAGLWQAQTPQMFRLGTLAGALAQVAGVTDEASAMEAIGIQPRLVPGELTNLKVTYADDLALAAMILRARTAEECT